MINISDHDRWRLFFFVMGIVILFLLSIPIALFMGLPWYSYTVKALEGILFIFLIIFGILSVFSESYEEGTEMLAGALVYWPGLLLLLFSIGIGFGSLMLGDKMWELKERKKNMELMTLKEKLGRGAITQGEYERREKKLLKSEKMIGKILMIVTFGVVIATVGEIIYLFPLECAMLFLVGIGLFALGTLYFGWKHPEWYVKLYTVICFFWEIFYFLACTLGAWGAIFGIAFVLVLLAGVTLPLIPLWYLMHVHGFSYERYRKEEKKIPTSFLKKCVKCDREIPIAFEECLYCGSEQPLRKASENSQ